MQQTSVLLVGINARTIQANPALYSLAKAAEEKGLADMLQIKEYALHTPTQHIMAEIFAAKPDILGFSFYIWNALLISQIIKDIKKLLPQTKIILGGPEASARAQHYLESLPVDAVCIGEGEESFTRLLAEISGLSSRKLISPDQEQKMILPQIKGFMFKNKEEQYQSAPTLDLAKLPFPYNAQAAAYLSEQNKLVYYESSRGCPYHCAFCASANEPLREKPLDLVWEDLRRLAKIGGQIKFIDRTFNAKKARAIAISKEILGLSRPGLSWHFEVSPFALSEEIVDLWISAPKDYLHLEIGVQSLNPRALAAVNRHGDWQKALPLVIKLIESPGCHVHLDLIAGLPEDTPRGFADSFYQLHQLNADYLQFGFLKGFTCVSAGGRCKRAGGDILRRSSLSGFSHSCDEPGVFV